MIYTELKKIYSGAKSFIQYFFLFFKTQTQIGSPVADTSNDDTIPLIKKEEKDDEKTVNWSKSENIVSNIKIMKQKALVKELQSKLTEDELEEEKR